MKETVKFKDLGLKKKKYEEIESQIKEKILNGSLKLSERLPTERKMVTQFGVSRVVVREAIRALELSGFIRVKKGAGGGTFVAQNYDSSLIRSITNFVEGEHESIENLLEARKLIEPYAVFKVAEQATKKETSQLKSLIEKTESLAAKGEKVRPYNIRFHRMILSFYHNPLLVAVGESVLITLMDKIKKASSQELSIEHLNFHRKIFHAIEAKDGVLAKKLMCEDISSFAKLLIGINSKNN